MALDIIVLNDSSQNYLNLEVFKSKYPHASIIDTSSGDVFRKILNKINTSQFWLINGDSFNFNLNFDFSIEPDQFDKLMKIKKFDNTFCLVNRLFFIKGTVTKQILSLKNIFEYDDLLIESNETKNNDFDIIFLSYKERFADLNLSILKDRFGSCVKNVDGIKGIVNAHFAAADLASTETFFVVDADAQILDNFNFNYTETNDPKFVKVWLSKNPLNNLIYGYGGVKLFHKSMFKQIPENIIDLSTSIASKGIQVINKISNITEFNTSELNTWRSAFRECAKLNSKSILNQNDNETQYRLNVWTTIANGKFSEYCLHGANEGAKFGELCKNNFEDLKSINDYEWLERQFSSHFSI